VLNHANKKSDTTAAATAAAVLHQYDSERKAKLKADTATKKNRLLLDSKDCLVKSTGQVEQGNKYTFTVSVLNGRVEWKLGAAFDATRAEWISVLSSNKNNDDDGASTATSKETLTKHDPANKKLKAEEGQA
jgi:hypothetical protein